MHLLHALRTVSRMESSSVRAMVFDDIASRSPKIRLVLRIHSLCRTLGVAHMLVGVYGVSYYIRCVLPQRSVRWLGIGCYPNELRHLDEIDRLMQDYAPARVTWKLVHFRGVWDVIRTIPNIKKLWRFCRLVKHIERRHGFMPACRVMATLFLYIRFSQWFVAHGCNAVVTTSDYSPDGAALTCAAAQHGVKRIIVPHALPSLEVDGRSMLSFDGYVLDSNAMRARFEYFQPITGEVVYRGLESVYAPLDITGLDNHSLHVAILLSGATNLDVLRQLIHTILQQHDARILVRGHPVDFANPDFSELQHISEHVQLSRGSSLMDDVRGKDLMIAANSTVILQGLRMGVPTVFCDALDGLPHDYNGFARDGLVYELPDISVVDVRDVRVFYEREDWCVRMEYFDAGYGRDAAQMQAQVKDALHRWMIRS